MPLGVEQILKETREWRDEEVSELMVRLTETLHGRNPEIGAVWEAEIDQRIEEIQSGRVQGIPAEKVFEKAQRSLEQ